MRFNKFRLCSVFKYFFLEKFKSEGSNICPNGEKCIVVHQLLLGALWCFYTSLLCWVSQRMYWFFHSNWMEQTKLLQNGVCHWEKTLEKYFHVENTPGCQVIV